MKHLTYGTYLDFLNALDEHTGCMMSKKALQKRIYCHYIQSGSFICYNGVGDKAIFRKRLIASIEDRASLRKDMEEFYDFMGKTSYRKI